MGHADIVKLVIDKEVDINVVDTQNRTALYHAACNGHASCVKNLLENCRINTKIADRHDRTPFIIAAYNGHLECVKEMMSEPTLDITATDSLQRTALHWAVENCHTDCVRYMVDNGIDVYAVDKLGFTAKMLARDELKFAQMNDISLTKFRGKDLKEII